MNADLDSDWRRYGNRSTSNNSNFEDRLLGVESALDINTPNITINKDADCCMTVQAVRSQSACHKKSNLRGVYIKKLFRLWMPFSTLIGVAMAINRSTTNNSNFEDHLLSVEMAFNINTPLIHLCVLVAFRVGRWLHLHFLHSHAMKSIYSVKVSSIPHPEV
jgi:hypothetical protein